MSEAIVGTLVSVTGQELETRLWKPEGTPRGVVQLAHGMSEHIARYDATAKRLSEAGYVVVGHTHLGHGDKSQTLGYFAGENGWDALIDDVHALRSRTQAEYPNLPYFLLGHSMGSFVARTYCLRYEKGLAGVILSGTGHFEPAVLAAGLTIARAQCALGGARKPSPLLAKISFAGYNKEWAPARTEYDWLTTDETVVDAYLADPYCGFPFTAGGYRDMFTGLKRLAPENLSAMEPDIPVLLLSGASDPVGGRGEGVKRTAKELSEAGVKDVTLKLYENGRHEMFNEKQRERVWDDLIAWLDGHAG